MNTRVLYKSVTYTVHNVLDYVSHDDGGSLTEARKRVE